MFSRRHGPKGQIVAVMQDKGQVVWRAHAACLGSDPQIFYPYDQSGRQNTYTEATALCARCTVRQECLNDALEARDFEGFRAGLRPAVLVQVHRRRIRATIGV